MLTKRGRQCAGRALSAAAILTVSGTTVSSALAQKKPWVKWLEIADTMMSSGWRITWITGASGNSSAISPRCVSFSGILSVNQSASGSTMPIWPTFCR